MCDTHKTCSGDAQALAKERCKHIVIALLTAIRLLCCRVFNYTSSHPCSCRQPCARYASDCRQCAVHICGESASSSSHWRSRACWSGQPYRHAALAATRSTALYASTRQLAVHAQHTRWSQQKPQKGQQRPRACPASKSPDTSPAASASPVCCLRPGCSDRCKTGAFSSQSYDNRQETQQAHW